MLASTIEQSCSRKCYPADYADEQSVQFQEGNTYVYKVKTFNKAQSEFNYSKNVSEDLTERLMELECSALIVPNGQCDITMRLKNIKVHLNDEATYDGNDPEIERFIRQLETPITCAYQYGIVTDVCMHHSESHDSYSLNVKKSIISALQTMPQLSTGSAKVNKTIKRIQFELVT